MRPRPMAGRTARRGSAGPRSGPPPRAGPTPPRGGGRQLPTALVAIHRLSELATIEGSPFGGLALGALVTHADLERSDLVRRRWTALADAAARLGSPPTRPARPPGGTRRKARPGRARGGAAPGRGSTHARGRSPAPRVPGAAHPGCRVRRGDRRGPGGRPLPD